MRGHGEGVQRPEFHKDYLKPVGEEPTPVMPAEMEKLDLPRAREIVALLKKMSSLICKETAAGVKKDLSAASLTVPYPATRRTLFNCRNSVAD